MKKGVAIFIALVLGWYGYQEYQRHERQSGVSAVSAVNQNKATSNTLSSERRFKCDGRVYCSQMILCAEAITYLKITVLGNTLLKAHSKCSFTIS